MKGLRTNGPVPRIARHYELETEIQIEHMAHNSTSPRLSVWHRLIRAVELHTLSHYGAGPPSWRVWIRRISSTRSLPDFCVVGPIKSGTTDLAVCLMAHPNVIPPLAKEFWSTDPETWRVYYPTERQKRHHAKRYRVALSPYCVPNLHSFEMVYNLSRVKPDTRIIIVLRDPVKRLYSQWKWELFVASHKGITLDPSLKRFDTFVNRALDLFPGTIMPSVCGFPALQTSVYWQAVQYWMSCFGRENVCILDVANYFKDKTSFLKQIYAFVGLPDVDAPRGYKIINKNPLRLPPPESATTLKLKEFFQPFNDNLWPLIGDRFNW